MQHNALLIFIKNPVLGKAKTRIAQSVGKGKALQIYLELLTHTRKIATTIAANRYLYYSDFVDMEDDWSAQNFYKFVQEGEDLGSRMSRAFEAAFQQNEKVIIVGSDCASLNSSIIEQAFLALDKQDFVLGPAKDGGYYLLGMRQFSPQLFTDISWSTADVLEETLDKIKALQKSYFLLQTLSDIDFWEDWLEYGWEENLKKL